MSRHTKRTELHPLVEAAKKRDFETVKSLLNSDGKRVSKQVLQECFVRCVLSRDMKLLDQLLAFGVDIDGSWNDYTVLSVASGFGGATFVRGLLKRGAGVDTVGLEKATPLIVSAKMGTEWKDPEIRRHSMAVARTLVSAGANVNARDMYRRTALDYAYQAYWEQMAHFLFSKGASIKSCDNGGSFLLFHAVSQPGTTKLLQMYLKNDGSPTIAVGFETTALEHAQRAGWSDKVKVLEKAIGG